MNEYKAALMEAGSPERVKQITDALFAPACGGDVSACKLLLDHWCGRAVQSIELSGTDAGPVKFDMAAFVGVIQAALADHPEAQYKLAAALKGAKLDGPDGPG